MKAIQVLLLGVGLSLPIADTRPSAATPDLARLREALHDRAQPVEQSQAALLLVQAHTAEADRMIRQALRETESPDVFLAITSALRLSEDRRFNAQLLAAVVSDRSALGQNAADSLCILAEPATMRRLEKLVDDERTDIRIRQAILVAFGRSGRRSAAAILIKHLRGTDALRQTAADGLAELTGHAYGTDLGLWRAWWAKHGNVSDERWLQERLYYQSSRARRLADELERTHGRVLHLEQQLHMRLPIADRLSHVQESVESEDPSVRALAVGWSLELLPSSDTVSRDTLAGVLLRLSHDSTETVQRQAVLALGRMAQPRVFERLLELLRADRPSIRAAAAQAATQQAANDNALRRQVVAALQNALEDPSWEVVVEAAEDLGSLGVPEAGPVLTALLRHSSDAVRQTAARALERVADVTVLDGLLSALADSAVAVRFSLVGAIGHAAGDGRNLTAAERARLLDRLQDLLERDPDAGVRSRAATVVGQCGSTELLSVLWRRVLAAEDARVQEKAWSAMLAIIVRSKQLGVVKNWDSQIVAAHQDLRRLQMLAAVADAWKSQEETVSLVAPLTEMLVQAQLDQGKWASALPLIQELLKQPSSAPQTEHRLRWLLLAGQQAIRAANSAECLHIVQDAQPFLTGNPALAAEFATLANKAKSEEPHGADR